MRQADLLSLLLFPLLLGWATPAVSQQNAEGPPPADWSTTFAADAVNSHVGAEGLQFIVGSPMRPGGPCRFDSEEHRPPAVSNRR
jgi:hypothetical protein